jgi:hypothetical protein
MATFTLAQLRSRVRQRADMETSQFVTDSEINGLINASIAELYDVIAQKYGNDYFAVSTQFTLANGAQSQALPADFYKLLGVDSRLDQNAWQTVNRFEFSERNLRDSQLLRIPAGNPEFRYKLFGNEIRFDVPMSQSTEIRVWYVPFPVQLVADVDTFDGYNGWEEYVVVDAAIKCLEKEESDTRDLQLRKQQLETRIESAAGNRDAQNPARIVDTRAINGLTPFGYAGDWYY